MAKMKTLTLSQLRRAPVAALKAVRSGRAVRVTKRTEVVAEFAATTPHYIQPFG